MKKGKERIEGVNGEKDDNGREGCSRKKEYNMLKEKEKNVKECETEDDIDKERHKIKRGDRGRNRQSKQGSTYRKKELENFA